MRSITIQEKQRAFEYYCLGLTSKDIGKLLDISHRTIQNYMSDEGWKEKRDELRERERQKIIRSYEKELRQSKTDTSKRRAK